MAKRTLTQRIQSIKHIYRAAKYIAQGGHFKVCLCWGEDEPRIIGGKTIKIKDNCLVQLDTLRESQLSHMYHKLADSMSIIPAGQYDHEGFRVKFSEYARDKERSKLFASLHEDKLDR
jgi:hypothetical protein